MCCGLELKHPPKSHVFSGEAFGKQWTMGMLYICQRINLFMSSQMNVGQVGRGGHWEYDLAPSSPSLSTC